jgi:hypothetical protein
MDDIPNVISVVIFIVTFEEKFIVTSVVSSSEVSVLLHKIPD